MTRSRIALLLSAVLAAAAIVVNARGHAPATALPPGTAMVAKVVDGDTVRVELNGASESVRLIGIDTPESVKPGTPVECFAREASAHLGELLPRGTPVRLVRDIEARDRYGRLLAYVYRSQDGLFVNLALARDGFAAPLTVPPNVAHSEEFAAAAGQARRAGRGLWSRCGGPHESGDSADANRDARGGAHAGADGGASAQRRAPP